MSTDAEARLRAWEPIVQAAIAYENAARAMRAPGEGPFPITDADAREMSAQSARWSDAQDALEEAVRALEPEHQPGSER